MSREWKPGDVATVDGLRALRTLRGWIDEDGDERIIVGRDPKYVRPLVVIDPEDREQVERLRGVFRDLDCLPGDKVEDWQAALREFANPKPPKPAEPTGLGAVVEDDKGQWWTRVRNDDETCAWQRVDGPMVQATWGLVHAVRVLSEGVQP